MKHIITLLLVCLLANFTSASMMGPWDMEKLSQVPQWEKTDKVAKPGMTGILYSSLPYKGKPVQVFAYYNAPEGTPPKGGWPAVVCVHGGGGTAFNDWVQRWEEHGYAAISMDLEGHYPIKNMERSSNQRRSTENPGPSRVGVFGDFEKPIDQQWYYHAVAQVVLAHSLIRSFPEVNADKIGITGISWGGTLTSTVMGVDNRFKFAIPVYGCGFLPDSDGHQGQTIKPGPQTDVVNTYFDGSAYFKNVTIPTLWVNGTNDKHFTMPTTQKSSQTVQGPAILRYQLEMPHGHGPGWRPEEVHAFADSVVKDGAPLIQFGKPQAKGNQAIVEFSSVTKVTKAEFLYTLDTTAWPSRKWKAVPATISGSTINATVPEDAAAFFFSAIDERKMMTTSELVLSEQSKPNLVMADDMTHEAVGVELYVSPTGSDTNSGSKNAPLASLEGMRALIASKNLAGREPVTVWVQDGTYHLAQPFQLGTKDAGTEKAPIAYRAVPGEEVVLKGSLLLDSKGWEPYKDGIYMQSLKGTPLEGQEFNQLFMSDKRMVRARFPNWDFVNPLRTGKGYLHVTNKRSTEMLTFDSADLKECAAQWKNPQAGIVHAFHVSNWGNFQFHIKELDLANNTIHFSEGGWQAQRRYGIGIKHEGQPGSPFYIENIFEELDVPFEWFHDALSNMLYFKPPAGVDLADVAVEAAVISRIIEVEGAEHLHFDGFHLTQTRATFMDAYDDIARGDWAVHRGGAVYFKDSKNCSVQNFHIEQVGGNGIFVDGFNREIHISGCLIEDTGDSAVCFVGNPKAVREYRTWEKKYEGPKDMEPGPKTDDYPANCSVKNTITRDVGVYGKQTSGVLVSMAMDITVDHCSVYRIARAGVTFNDGTWGGHLMSNCDVYDTILDTGEHGPFNSWGRERFWSKNMDKSRVMLDAIKTVKLHDNRIGNYRSSISAGNWTIDLDDGSSNFEIYNNLMLGSTLKLRDGFYRKVWNNIMVSAVPVGIHCWPKDNSDDVIERNIVVVAGAIEGSGKVSQTMIVPLVMPADYGIWGHFNSNLWWNTNAKDFAAQKYVNSLAQWQEKQGKDGLFADPLFVDPVNRNYHVKENSPALKLGFKNFPMDQFGHQMTQIMCGSGDFEGTIKVVIRPDARGGEVRYTIDGSEPTADSQRYSSSLTIDKTTTLCASTFDAHGHEVGFADRVVLTNVEKVIRQSWLASLLAGEYVGPVKKDKTVSKKPQSMNWTGMELVTISDFPDYIDASGGQFFGAFVVKLDAGSKAAAAGFKNGDTIIRVGSTEVRNIDDLTDVMRSATGPVSCKVFRGYKHYEITLDP